MSKNETLMTLFIVLVMGDQFHNLKLNDYYVQNSAIN